MPAVKRVSCKRGLGSDSDLRAGRLDNVKGRGLEYLYAKQLYSSVVLRAHKYEPTGHYNVYTSESSRAFPVSVPCVV